MRASATVGVTRRQLLGNNPPLIALTTLMVLAAYTFAWGWLSAPPNDLGNVLSVGSMLAGCVTAVFVIGTSRVVGDAREGYVDMVNLIVTRRVPVEEIAGVTATHGLQLQLKSGGRVGSTAYGSSLAGQIGGYFRAEAAVSVVEAFLYALPPTWWYAPGRRPVVTRLRVVDIVAGLMMGTLLLAGTVILNVLRSA